MKLEYSHPLWGLSEDDGIPPKSVLFNSDYQSVMAMEDFLGHNEVFINGFGATKRTCHPDSYGTIVDFDALKKALDFLNETYAPTAEDWKYHLRYWLTNPNMQPPLRLIAFTIAGKLNIDIVELQAGKPK